MEEKARLYASMKRGDYVPTSTRHDREAQGLVDFDRKWAEKEEKDAENNENNTSSDDYGASDADDEPAAQIEYEDEFGRLRTGTHADAAREQRRRDAQSPRHRLFGRVLGPPADPAPGEPDPRGHGAGSGIQPGREADGADGVAGGEAGPQCDAA